MKKVGLVQVGDTLGEEGLFEQDVARKETVVAVGDSFILKLEKTNFEQLEQKLLHTSHLALDWFTLVNHMKT